MGKYIHKFETINALNDVYNSVSYRQPWVSYTVENDQMNYDQLSKEDIIGLDKPLCIEATQAATDLYAIVYYDGYMPPPELEYSLNNGSTWDSVDLLEEPVQIDEDLYGYRISGMGVGDKTLLRGNNSSCAYYQGYGISSCLSFYATKPCYVSGSPCSLLVSKDFDTMVCLPECAFAYLFGRNGSWVLMDPENPLILPIKQLSFGCYSHMFEGCSNLEYAPLLPATTLASSCYESMFKNCTSLTTVSDLPAISLPGGCYSHMFEGCTSLVNAPDILATTHSGTMAYSGCCSGMFYGCTSLINTPKFRILNLTGTAASNSPGNSIYSSMFYGCTSLITPPELPATTLSPYCYQSMFEDCTSLTSMPNLPATTLSSNCYQYMFKNCTNLTTVSELSATILQYYCYRGMFDGCTSLTTAPDILTTNVSSSSSQCFSEMFKNCSSLNYIKCLVSNNITTYNFSNWTSGVSATGTFVQDPTANWPVGVNGIPSGWTCNVFRIDTTSYTVDALNKTINLTGYCGYDNYTITSSSNWITINSPNGTTGSINKNLTIANNTGSASRQGTITASVPNTDISVSITIIQQAPALTISQSATTVGLNGGTIHISGRSTYSSNWSLTNNESWITDNISSYAPGNIDFDLTIASGSSQRSATLYITCDGQTHNITVNQEQLTQYYSIDLWDGDWIVDTGNSGPNGEVVYKSDYNYNQNSDEDEEDYAGMTITVNGYNTFTIYVRTNGENNYDYLVVSQLNKIPSYSNSSTNNKWYGKGKASASTWSEITFTNIPSGTHEIRLYYFKDDSGHDGEDRGFVYIPSTYNKL